MHTHGHINVLTSKDFNEIFTDEEEEMKRVFIQWMRVKRRSTILIILMARTVRATITITITTERVAI